MQFEISKGFAPQERQRVAELYWEAFEAKLSIVMGPPEKALSFLQNHMDPAFALVARGADGEILGIAGYKMDDGALVGGSFADLVRTYGIFSCLWRALLLALIERDQAHGILLMDGICVSADARGLGVGTALLNAIVDQAKSLGQNAVRLDVIDTNPRAKALYERVGFVDVGQENLGPLRWIFGFRTATKMLRSIPR